MFVRAFFMLRVSLQDFRFAFAFAGAVAATGAARAAEPAVFSADAAWCWFSDPRALVVDGVIRAGWVSADGSVQVGRRALAGTATEIATLAPQFERDDHDNPGFVALPDGRLAAFYSAHARGDTHLRISGVGDAWTKWSDDRELGFINRPPGPRGVTYASPFRLSEERNALWVFWRGSDFKPTFAISRDLGATWCEPRTLIAESGRDANNRPYVKYWSDGRGRIDFIFTDGHPRNEPSNSVYFARYEHGEFRRADGTRIGGLDELPIAPSKCDRVYDGASAGRGWIWSLANDANGNPVIAYTRLPAENDHRYRYVRWDGAAWRDHEIVAAGKWFPLTPEGKSEPEPHYSGGIALDPADPATVFLSRPVNGVFEIERWRTPDGGATWTHEAITRDSKHDNVRPYVVPGAPKGRRVVMWMRNTGGYVHYTNYRSELWSLVE